MHGNAVRPVLQNNARARPVRHDPSGQPRNSPPLPGCNGAGKDPTTNRITCHGEPVLVYGMVRLVPRPVAAALILLLACTAAAPALAAGGSTLPAPLLAPAVQNLSLAGAAAAEGQPTLTSLETPRTVTILHIEGPKGEYPGARPAAEGPLWIDITLEPGALIILAAAAVIAAAGYVLYRKRKASRIAREQKEEEARG